MVCVPLSPTAPFTATRPMLTTFPPSAPNLPTIGPANRIPIGSEPRDVALARLRARLLRMIVDNERVRHELRIRPR
jgi:hypothetical protein